LKTGISIWLTHRDSHLKLAELPPEMTFPSFALVTMDTATGKLACQHTDRTSMK